MRKNRVRLFTKIALIIGVVPIVIYAYEYGPPPGVTGAPGDNGNASGGGTCLSSGCHSGTLTGPGSVKIVLPNGNTYTPGVKQHVMVQITDSTRQKFGFELSARLNSNLVSGQAGDFSTTDGLTQVVCDLGPKANGSLCDPGAPVQFVEHTMAGYSASTAGGYTYQFDWTPPATNVGNVTMYVASNAGPGGSPNQNNADIYLANVTLTPAAASTGPTIDAGGVVPVDSAATTIQPGSWVSVYSFKAQNLTSQTVLWNGDFPTKLGDVSVTINNKPAYLWFVSPSQINLQAPDDTATGTVPVTVTNSSGSTTTTVNLAPQGPAFLLLGDGTHATGIIITPNGSGSQGGGVYDLLGPTSAGAGFRPVNKGEVVTLYGIGFGPTSPPVAAGKACPASGCPTTVPAPQITLGGIAVQASASLPEAGLYQFNFTVPANAGSGDQAVQAIVNGVQTPANVFVAVQ